MKHFGYIRSVLFFLCICHNPSYAWWDAGHKLVAYIAYAQLDEATRTHVDVLTEVLQRDYPKTHLATWPDEIRKDSIEVYTHWHYIDMPYYSDEVSTGMIMDTDNGVWALEQIERILLNKRIKPSERARFTSLLIHITGDLHQPLHCISRAHAALPEGDSGGNLFFVLDPDDTNKRMTLHALWDSHFGLFRVMDEEQLMQMAHELMRRYPKESFTKEEVHAPARVWAKEGYRLAIDWVYRTPEERQPTVTYQKKSKELMDQRITLAGYRLAELLSKYAALVEKRGNVR